MDNDAFSGNTGKNILTIIPTPKAVVDSHMHIMSSNCTPLPLLWKDIINIPIPRTVINRGVPWIFDNISVLLVKTGNIAKEIEKRLGILDDATDVIVKDLGLLLIDITKAFVETIYGINKIRSGVVNLEADTLILILDLVKDEIKKGLSLIHNVTEIIENVSQRVSEIRKQAQNESIDDIIPQYFFFTKLQFKVLDIAIDLSIMIAEGIIKGVKFVVKTNEEIAKLIGKLHEKATSAVQLVVKNLKIMDDFTGTMISKAIANIITLYSERLFDIGQKANKIKGAILEKLALLFHNSSELCQKIDETITPLSTTAEIGREDTITIAKKAVRDAATTYKNKNYTMTPLIPQPMDMEYTHLDGYKGEPIYRKSEKKYFMITPDGNIYEFPPDYKPTTDKINILSEPHEQYYYYKRESARYKSSAKWIWKEENKLFKDWKKQVKDTVLAAVQFPWQLIPMYHYEPRRWIKDKKYNWDNPFSCIINSKEKNKEKCVFIGFKMYPSLGYQPWDVKEMPRMEDFYKRCAEDKIPILFHCSPGGMITHERKFYLEYARSKDPSLKNKYQIAKAEISPEVRFYQENYPAPKGPNGWKTVLDNVGELRLCLAHFGGGGDSVEDKAYSGWIEPSPLGKWNEDIIDLMQNYKYVYTDIAYFIIQNHYEKFKNLLKNNTVLKSRILFGTDWYMTELGNLDYNKFSIDAKNQIDKLDDELRTDGTLSEDEISLWTRFSMVNPFNFYNFENIIDDYYNALKSLGANSKKNFIGQRDMQKIVTHIEKLHEMNKV